MDVNDKKDEADLQQNLDQKAAFSRLFQFHLLFEKEPVRPEPEVVKATLERKFGEVDIVSGDENLSTFALFSFMITYQDGQMPAQVLMADAAPFVQDSIGSLERTQLWDVEDGEGLLERCQYQLMISDFVASGLDYKERCRLLVGWLEVMMDLMPDCMAVWVPSAGKLLTGAQVRSNQAKEDAKFIYLGVNVRFFRIQGSNDMLVDTLGLFAVGLPDVQYHFHDLDPNAVTNHAYNVASYLFAANAPIQDGETIDGLQDGQMSRQIQWKCQYEMSLIQPSREVMDICPGEYAAGGRE